MDMTAERKPAGERLVSICLLLFSISLPFHEIEWDLFRVARFEIKPTMITFALLFSAWVYYLLRNRLRINKIDLVFAALSLVYACSQFLSAIGSPFRPESFKQSIIITSLMVMMFVVSQSVLNKRTLRQIFIAQGYICLAIVTVALTHYLFFTDRSSRLGQLNSLGFFHLGGDTYYFGDVILFNAGALAYLMFNSLNTRWGLFLKWIFAGILFSAVALTFTKSLIISAFFFFAVFFFFVKGRRAMAILGIILLAAVLGMNYLCVRQRIVQPGLVIQQTAAMDLPQSDVAQSQLLARMNILSTYGSNSFGVRWKSIIVSIRNSIPHFWFGNGAGISQRLIGDMANEYDRSLPLKEAELMMQRSLYGEEVNANLVDGHNLFIAEFFNVGFTGFAAVLALTVFVLFRLARLVKKIDGRRDIIPHLLLATTAALLFFRMTGSLIVLPSLWFMFGLSMGTARLYAKELPDREGA